MFQHKCKIENFYANTMRYVPSGIHLLLSVGVKVILAMNCHQSTGVDRKEYLAVPRLALIILQSAHVHTHSPHFTHFFYFTCIDDLSYILKAKKLICMI